MERKSLQQWKDTCSAYSSRKLYMQDRYLKMKPEDLLMYTGEGTKRKWEGTVGYEISEMETNVMLGGVEESEEEEIFEQIYALMITPFEQWLTKTGYEPEVMEI